MPVDPKMGRIGLLTSNPAWAELASATLDIAGFRCATFARAEQLAAFISLTPVAILLLDPEPGDIAILDLSAYLRRQPAVCSQFKMAIMTRTPPRFHKALIGSGFDLVIEKPASHVDLLDHVKHLSEQLSGDAKAQLVQSLRADSAPQQHSGNVVPLFPTRSSWRRGAVTQFRGRRSAGE